ncbi:MAG: ATP-binding protein [Candidatus Saccharibacteria bacterium]|nr:ATP-binding protein [Candidatus Saccharibacteria bacterium]
MGVNLFSKLFKTDRDGSDFSRGVADSVKAQIVIETISDGIAIVDAQGIIQLFNPAASALTGWPTDQAINLDYRSVLKLTNNAGRELEPNDNPIIKAMNSRSTAASDNIYASTASDKKIQISLKATPIIRQNKNGDQVLVGLVIVFRDITRERAEQNAQTDFISTASHEMRTPVATIEGYIGMILNPKICTIDERARDYANKSHEAVQHLGRLFSDLLDVTKADDSRLNLNPVLIDAHIAAQQIVDRFQPNAQKKGLSLNLASSTKVSSGNAMTITPPSIIYADLDRLDEVISNMVENAIKYTPQGHVSVSVTNVDKKVRITVADTGIGIPAEDLPHLFQKFYRIDNRETREIGGTGLGLYLIKKLTTSMGGTVDVSSKYGRGTTFWVEFDNLNREEAVQKAREIKAREAKRRQAAQG